MGISLLASCGSHHQSGVHLAGAYSSHQRNVEVQVDPQATLLPGPEASYPDLHPCFDCHDPDFMEVDTSVRELGDPHDTMPFNHAGERIWCMDCHDADDHELLRLANGTTLEYAESPQLCGQCHGMQHRDWQAGAHGKRTGNWDGAKEYMTCTSCHNPHDPVFGHLEPMAPPTPPEPTR